jgi:hypothetical protein
MRRWYSSTPAGLSQALTASTLAHIASCRRCLGAACDTVGVRPPDDPFDGPSGEHRHATGRTQQIRGARKRLRDLLEHRPRQLLVSINGHHVGLVSVESARTALRWTVRLEEPVAFAELFSDQGLRMALLHADTPPHGDLLQQIRLNLSDERTLTLSLDYSGTHPAVGLEYLDPSLLPAAAVSEGADEGPSLEPGASDEPLSFGTRLVGRVHGWLQWFRPAFAVPILIVAIGLLAWSVANRDRAVPPAAPLLERAIRMTPTPSAGRVHHQTLRLVSGQASSATPAHRYHIDVWTSPESRAVRVSDEAGHLVAGEWRSADGRTQTLPLNAFDAVWRGGLSASAFDARYAANGAHCRTAASGDQFLVTCESARESSWLEVFAPALLAAPLDRPASAVLILRRADLHVLSLRLIFGSGDSASHVSLEEEQFSDVPASAVPAGTFAPPPPASAATPRRNVRTVATAVEVTPSLELTVVELLDRLAGDDALEITRTDTGRLKVSGLVSSSALRRELVAHLERLSPAGTLAIDIATYAEMTARAGARGRTMGQPTIRHEVHELPTGAPAIGRYFAERMSEGQARAIVQELSPRVLEEARIVRLHATRLFNLLEAYPEADVRGLAPEGRSAWRALLVRRAALAATALQSLDRLLEPHFAWNPDDALTAALTIPEAARRLAHEAGVLESAITAAFTAQPEGAPRRDETTPTDFRQHLRQALADALLIERDLRP